MKSNIIILIVEDEIFIAQMIESQIRKMGYEYINIAINYNHAINKIKKQTPDLILLDIDLKNKKYDGIDIANNNMVLNRIPVIYLTEDKRFTIRERMEETNPKAYMTKPIRYEELEFNIRMAVGHKNGNIDIGYNYFYNSEDLNLFYKNQPVKLSRKEMILLRTLISGKGEAIPINILEFEIWGNNFRSDSSLRTLVAKLRKKLNSKMIVNILSFGYKLILPKKK